MTTTSRYDELNRRTEITGDFNNIHTTLVYDALDNLLRRLTPTTWYLSAFDSLSRLMETRQEDNLARQNSTQPIERPVFYFYDIAGNRTEVRQAQKIGWAAQGYGRFEDNRTTYAYDALNRNTATTSPNRYQSEFTYYADGRLYQSVDRLWRKRRFTYDELGRLKQETWQIGLIAYITTSTFTYAYDALDNRLTAASTEVRNNQTFSFTRTRTYDSLGRVLTETQAPFGVTFTYTYDFTAHRRWVTVADHYAANDATTETLSGYDAAGRLILRSVKMDGRQYAYVRQDWRRPNANEARSYDYVSSVSYLTAHRRTPNITGNFRVNRQMQTQTITYRSDGWRMEDMWYNYDRYGRLREDDRKLYAYRTVNNVQPTWGGGWDQPTIFTYDKGDQTRRVPTATLTYDNNGNLVQTWTKLGYGNRLLEDNTYRYVYNREGGRARRVEVDNVLN